jgi:hypothetical protein
VKALNKRPVTTDSKAGAVKGGEGLAVDVLAAVMFEGNNKDADQPDASVRSLNEACGMVRRSRMRQALRR